MFKVILVIITISLISCNNNPSSEVRMTTLDYSKINVFLKDSLPHVIEFNAKYNSEFNKWKYIKELDEVKVFFLIDAAQLSYPLNTLKTNIQKIDENNIPELFNSPQIIGRFRVLKTDILKINIDDVSDLNVNTFKNHIKDIVNSYNALVSMMNLEVKKSNEININLD